ncbi:hypothetical protein ACFL0E_00015 [Nanoarchaeota archaeon]
MTKEFCRVEVYSKGLYGIWTEGFRTNRGDLSEILNLPELESKDIYISKNLSLVNINIGYVPDSDKRIQEINFAVVNGSKEKTEICVDGIVRAISLYERTVPLEEEEIPEVHRKLNSSFFIYRVYTAVKKNFSK